MSSVTVDFNANVARFSSALDKATNDMNKFQSNSARMSANIGKSFAGIGAALGGALSVAAFSGWIKGSIDAADELSKLAQKTGTAVEELAGLKFAADQNGTSLEAVANAAKKLTASIVDKPDLFKKMGINAKDSTGALVQLADIFAGMPDGVEKTALAVKLMGKSGEEMIPFLNQGSKALEELTAQGKLYNPITAESAKQAELFNDQLDALKAQANGLGVTIAKDMLPMMTDITTAMSQAAKESGLLSAAWVGLGGIGAAMFTDEFDDAAQQIINLRGELGDLERHREQLDPGKGGFLQRWLYGTAAEVDVKIANTKKQIADLQISINKPAQTVQPKTKNDGRGVAILKAIGGNKEEKKQELKDYDQHIKEFVKIQDAANKEMTQSALEAQRIIADIDPIYKASLAWEELSALVEKGFITAEQAGQSYASNFQKSTDEMSSFAKRAGENIQDSFAEFLFDPFKDGLGGMLKNFQIMLQRMAAQAAAAKILGSIGEWGTTGSGTGTFVGGIAAAMFGGKKALGGPVTGGKTYLVGERGPELFTPSGGGNITPNDKLGKPVTVINNFIVSQPTDRRTQEQIASMAGASVQRAMLRGA